VRLGELISRAEVERCGDKQLPVLSMTMHDGIVRQRDRFKKAIASKDTSNYKVVYPQQLVVGFPIDEGVIYVQNFDEPGIMSPAYNVWDIDTTKVHPAYLELALHSPQTMTYYEVQMKGTTARRRTLSKDKLRDIKVVLPPPEKQLQVARLFQQVNELLRASKAREAALDSLVKSRFVEMFGDPISNPKGLLTKLGKELFKLGNGKAKPASQRIESGVPAYGGNGISWYTDEAMIEQPTIVLGRVGRHCGNARLVTEPCWVTDNAMYIRTFYDDSLDFTYLIYLMNIVGFNRYADEGDLWKITQQPFMGFPYPLPPPALQREFADFASCVDKLRFMPLVTAPDNRRIEGGRLL
jgi:type I restriction enzyme S subunit